MPYTVGLQRDPCLHVPQVPLGDDPTKWVECKLIIELVRVSTDFVAKTLLGPTPRSCSSWHYCPDCNFDKRAADYDKPFSFLQGAACGCTRWKLRTTENTLSVLDKAFDESKPISKTAREKLLRRNGLRPNMTSESAS